MRNLTESELDSVAGGQTPAASLNAVTAGLAGLSAGPGENAVVIAPNLQVTAPGGLSFGASGAFLAPTTADQTPSVQIFSV